MNPRLVYLIRNLTRNPLRTLLTCAAIGLPILIYVLAFSVISGINDFLNDAAKNLRLAVIQKTSIVNPLPWGHRKKIEALDPDGHRIKSVCCLSWIGGRIEGKPQLLSTMAADADTFLDTFTDYKLNEEQRAVWFRDRRAIIVGHGTADQFGWREGDRITIQMSIPPYKLMEFTVASVAREVKDPVSNFFRMDYLNEVMKENNGPTDIASFIFVKCASKKDLDYFRVKIDESFARTPDETRTQDEKAFMSEYLTQQFDLPTNLTILAVTTIFVAVMAAANTMSMNIRDRISEIATLRSLGFSSRTIFASVQLESLTLCLIGGILGAVGPYLAFTYTPLGNIYVPVLQVLVIKPVVCVQALGVAIAVGIAAAAWPSIMAARLPLVTALRNLE